MASKRYSMQCGCGEKLMVTDATKREVFRDHWREECPAAPPKYN